MKICKSCVYFRDRTLNYWCAHPDLGSSHITGEPKLELAVVMRSHRVSRTSVFCGPEALLHKEHAKKESRDFAAQKPVWWKRLLAYLQH